MVFDDFGTGYASLSYLKKFPLDGLKIDKSFVFELLTDSDDAAIVNLTVGLSKQLGLSKIAEGIENRASADLLLTMGCEEGKVTFSASLCPSGSSKINSARSLQQLDRLDPPKRLLKAKHRDQ